jgi:hypothetical protein
MIRTLVDMQASSEIIGPSAVQAYGTSEGVKKEWDERGRGLRQVLKKHGFRPDAEADPKGDFVKSRGGRTHQVSIVGDRFDHYSWKRGADMENDDDETVDYKEHGGGKGTAALESHLEKHGI